MKMIKLWFVLVLVMVMGVYPSGSQRGHRDYLTWLYQRFRTIFWGQGSRTRQFAVVTVGQLNEFPNPDPADLPLFNPDDWNAAYYADTIPNHTEPVLFERLRQMILDYLQQFNTLPRDIYLFTYNIPCPHCTQTIVNFIENVIPDTIRQFVREHPRYLYVLFQIPNMNFRIGWNTERGNQAFTLATVEDFRDTNDDANVPNIYLYLRLLLVPVAVCRGSFSGARKRRQISSSEYLTTDWRLISGGLKHVSAGNGGVWGVNDKDEIFYKPGTYGFSESIGSGDWQLVDGLLKQLDVGYNSVWGVNSNNEVFQRAGISKANPTGTSWHQVTGPKFKQISVSSSGHVWAISTGNEPYWRSGEGTLTRQGRHWERISGGLIQISVGWAGVWAVNQNDDVYYREGTFGDRYGSGSRWLKVSSGFVCVASGGGLVWALNGNDEVFARHGISADTPTGLYWVKIDGGLKQIDVSLRGIWGVNNRNEIFGRLATFGFDMADVSPNWDKVPGLAKHISTGHSGVWAINDAGEILYRYATYGRNRNSRGTGDWHKVDGFLKQVDVGDRVVWGVNSDDVVFIREGISADKPWGTRWREVGDRLKHVSVSPTGSVWGVNTQNAVYRRVGTSTSNPRGTSWKQIDGSMKQISSGAAGVWAVNSSDEVFYRSGTFFGTQGVDGSTWQKVDGLLKYVSSGRGVVWGVNSNNDIFYKDGVGLFTPGGNPWKQVPGRLVQVEVFDDDDGVWGISSNQEIFGHSC